MRDFLFRECCYALSSKIVFPSTAKLCQGGADWQGQSEGKSNIRLFMALQVPVEEENCVWLGFVVLSAVKMKQSN